MDDSQVVVDVGSVSRAGIALTAALLLGACATPSMEAQWRDPQLAPKSLQGKGVLVVCRGLDQTLERICEDRLAGDAAAAGARVMRAEVTRDGGQDATVATESLLKAARAVRADALLSMWLERGPVVVAPQGGSVGIGVGGSSGGWGSRTGGGIGITLPIGGATGPALGASTSLTDAGSGKLMWSGRARSSGRSNEAEQLGELSRITAEALKGSGLF